MARRKRHPKLPNGYGTIQYLGKGRRNPYCVRPPVSEYDDEGRAIRPSPICYTETWTAAFVALTAWKAGTYTPGMETSFADADETSSDVVRRVLADYSRISKRTDGMTFSEAYTAAYEHKISHFDLTDSTKQAYKSGFEYCKSIHNATLANLTHSDLQKVIDDCHLGYASQNRIKTVIALVYKYAISNGIVFVDYSKGLICKKNEVKHGQAFTEEQLKRFWALSKIDDDAKRVVIMCYSGFRVSAYKNLEINLSEKYFKGGVKTAASKNRTVPIHSTILPLVKYLMRKYGTLDIDTRKMAKYMPTVVKGSTPHWARHTFSALCEKYGVRENDRKRMLGHSIGDITNDIYGHRTLEELRTEIEKISVPKFAQQFSDN